MKKHLIWVTLILLLAMIFVACGEKAPANSGAVVLKTIDNLSDYVIVRSGNSNSEITKEATTLRKAINDATNSGVAIKTDDFKAQYEILVGKTSRQESIDAHEGLRSSDYVIKMVGKKIVIAAGSDEALVSACDFYKTNFINAEGKWVKSPTGDGYRVNGKYLVDSLSVDGVDISEFSIYYEGKLLDAASICEKLCDAFGVGQQCFHGVKDMVSVTIEDFVNSTGQKPGIIGIDTGCYGVMMPTITLEIVSQLVCEIVDYCADGGIVTCSAHWTNPYAPDQLVRGNLGSFETEEEYEAALRAVFTPGNEYYDYFMDILALDADLFEALEDNYVTIIYRPIHEMNGNWFWFCVTQNGKTMSAEVMVDFWKFIYNYMEEERGLDNLLWNYGPNTSGNVENNPGGTMGPMYCYPGDEYVDMVGVDWYTSGNLEITGSNNYLDMIDQTHKIGAITEFGVGGAVKASSYEEQHKYYSANNLLIDLWTLMEEGYNFAYLLTWHNQSFCTIGAMGGESGGFDFMNEEYTLGQADVKALFDSLK